LGNHDPLIVAILKILFDHNGRISSYSVFKKLKVPIADFMRKVFEAQDKKFLLFNEDWVEITELGRNILTRPRSESYPLNKSFRSGVPEEFLREFQLQPDSLYVPSISRLDLTLQKKILRANIAAERAK
jgi:hypothetical protein